MRYIGHPFEYIDPDVEELRVPGESPADHVTRLSLVKARKIGLDLADGIVIGSDTIVVLDNDILEKPANAAEAVEMLSRLQGRTHTVYTGFALYNAATRKYFFDYETTRVTMRPFDRGLAERYIATGEPMDKAGAYGIQGFGAVLIAGIEGDYFTVMGLPLARLMAALETFTGGGVPYFGIRPRAPGGTEE